MDIITQVCSFTEELLSYNHDLVLRGREGFERLDFNGNYIVIDELAAVQIASNEKFDPDAATYKKVLNMLSDITVDFYGVDALSNAQRWSAIKNLQPGQEIQSEKEITIMQMGSIRNLRQISGTDYGNRYQISLKVWYNIEEQVTINSIETLNINYINNK